MPKILQKRITPNIARKMLEQNTCNRPKSMLHAGRLAEAMRRNEWKLNGETIVLNCDGTLIDGQHRLQACIIADVPFDTLVVYGIEGDVFPTIDQGRVRTISDALALTREKYYTQLATAIGWARRIESKCVRVWSKLTPTQAMDYIENNPGMRNSVGMVCPLKIGPICSASLASTIHYLATKSLCDGDPEKPNAFILSVVTGENLSATNPAYLFRERMLRDKAAQAKLPMMVTAALLAKSIGASIRGGRMKVLRWTANEEFPYGELGIQ